MGHRSRSFSSHGLRTLAPLAVTVVCVFAVTPRGWMLAGSNPTSYESGIDAQISCSGHPAAFLKSTATHIDGFGTLMQEFRADHYVGKRVRFSAFVKTQDASGWAGLWMRIDKGATQLAFDNMQNRPIKGTTDWQKYDVVLDVPQDATGVFFGVLLGGTGEVWISNVKFEAVGPDVPTTSTPPPMLSAEPTNLNFEN
jgi:hypothetical protein